MIEYDEFQGWCILKDDRSLQRAVKKQVRQSVDYYQLHHLDAAIKQVHRRGVAVDIGAHYGVMTRNLAKLFKHVHSFEIDPNVYSCLEKNMQTFKVHNATTYPYGLGDKQAQVGLNFKQGKTFSTHVNLSATDNLVPVRTLDSFDIRDVDLIKIDAEGFEPLIIQGGLNTIEKYKPVILYECKGHETRYGYERDAVLTMLEPLGYQELHLWDLKNKLIAVK